MIWATALRTADVVHRLLLDVEHDVADLGAGAVDDLDALAGLVAQRLDVGRGEAAVGDVDVTLLDRQLQRRGLLEVLDDEVLGLALVRARCSSGSILNTACWLGVYFSSLYGPEPIALSSGCFSSAG